MEKEKTGVITSDGFAWIGYWEPTPPGIVEKGLNKWANALVNTESTQVVVLVEVFHTYPDGRRELVKTTARYKTTEKTHKGKASSSDDGREIDLFSHLLPDERRFDEVLQATIDDTDFFLALAGPDGKTIPESLWTWEELEERKLEYKQRK